MKACLVEKKEDNVLLYIYDASPRGFIHMSNVQFMHASLKYRNIISTLVLVQYLDIIACTENGFYLYLVN